MPDITSPTIVPPGKILDFIDGTLRNDTPEEYVRQEILKSLVREYQYPREDIGVEVPIRIGSKRARVDIVIYPPDTPKSERSQLNALIVIECKRPGTSPASKTEGIAQLHSYLAVCPSAEAGMWTNGSDLSAYQLVTKNQVRIPEEIRDIPHYGQSIADADRPTFASLRPAASDSLLFAFRRSHDYISGNQGMQKPEAFWELLKLIFSKIQDERNSPQPEFYAAESERQSAAGLLRVRKRISALFDQVKRAYPQIFKDAEEIELQPNILAFIVAQLQNYSLLSSDVDVKGKAYEEVVGSNLRGDRGEFFTPRNICHMMVAMIDPKETDVVLDPACGTGGFLTAAMNYVMAGVRHDVYDSGRTKEVQDEAIRTRIASFLRQGLVGLDFNPNLVRASKMNMVMNNDGSAGLYQANSLAAPITWSDELRERGIMGNVDKILTNPPFGSKIPIDDPAILSQYDLGHQWTYDEEADEWRMSSETTSRPPEILFIERCVELLKAGDGVAAMVLPDGILGSPGLGFVRQWLLKHTQILASVDLHPDTFQPGTSVQTSVLIVRKKSAEEVQVERLAGQLQDYDIFMAICDHVGHDKRGNQIYLRDDDGYEVVREVEDAVTSAPDHASESQHHVAQERVVDDNTQEIAQTYRRWLAGAL